MAEISKEPKNTGKNRQGELKNHAKLSSPSFNNANNKANSMQEIAKNPKAAIKKKLLKEGIKKGAQAYGVPEVATEKVLDSSVGREALDAAANAPSITSGAAEATKVIVKKTVLPVILISTLAPFLIIILFCLIIFGKDSFGGMGDGTDIYEELRKEIGSTISDYQGRADIDGVLILATLIGYNDNEGIEDSSAIAKNMANMKKQVDKLADYQIMVTKDCSDDSSTIRKIAGNDPIIGEENRNCIAGTNGSTYSLSIEEGEFDNDNSGSVYYWNLIDEEFIFDYYNEYMINKNHNTSENDEKIEEIISEIYSYYQSLLLEGAGADYFASYITNTGYWWPIGSRETTVVNGKTFAKGTPGSTTITAWFGGDDSVHKGSHGAIDIGGVRNVDNVIATKSGTVIYPYNKSQTRYGEGYLGCRDGGGYGNYVIIDHGDGTYSLYAHMHRDTISVLAGDVVEQGQVIGKLGHSGNSTGPHLHFEIRSGGSTRDYKVDPLLYVDPDNPRPTGGNDFFTWVSNIERPDCDSDSSCSDGDDYIVYKTNTGSLDVAYGIQLINPDGSKNIYYPDIYDGPVEEGTRIPKETVKKLFNRIYAADVEVLLRARAKYNVVLSKNQEVAILSLAYNVGGDEINPAVKAFSEGGADGYWNFIKSFYSSANPDNECGLKIRRAEEYELFIEGDYKYDPLSWSCSKIKYYDTNSW